MSGKEEQDVVMVIDDLPANLNLLVDALGMHGFRVLSFPKGSLALQALQITLPDIILLDIKMPEMSGYEVCEKIKQDPRTAQIPIIFMSGYDAEDERNKVQAVGGAGYITKPIDILKIADVIRFYIRR